MTQSFSCVICNIRRKLALSVILLIFRVTMTLSSIRFTNVDSTSLTDSTNRAGRNLGNLEVSFTARDCVLLNFVVDKEV